MSRENPLFPTFRGRLYFLFVVFSVGVATPTCAVGPMFPGTSMYGELQVQQIFSVTPAADQINNLGHVSEFCPMSEFSSRTCSVSSTIEKNNVCTEVVEEPIDIETGIILSNSATENKHVRAAVTGGPTQGPVCAVVQNLFPTDPCSVGTFEFINEPVHIKVVPPKMSWFRFVCRVCRTLFVQLPQWVLLTLRDGLAAVYSAAVWLWTGDLTYLRLMRAPPPPQFFLPQELEKRLVKGIAFPDTMKHRYDFAAYDSGARIVDSAPGVQHSRAIQKGDSDSYLLARCNQPIWLVIAFNTQIYLKAISLLSQESYSSTFRLIQILGSNSYPTKRWRLLAMLPANVDLSHELFDVESSCSKLKPSGCWVRFIKVQVIDSYQIGRFGYCTLNRLQAFGSDILESLDTKLKGESEDDGEDEPVPTVPMLEEVSDTTIIVEEEDDEQPTIAPEQPKLSTDIISVEVDTTNGGSKLVDEPVNPPKSVDNENPDIPLVSSASESCRTEDLSNKELQGNGTLLEAHNRMLSRNVQFALIEGTPPSTSHQGILPILDVPSSDTAPKNHNQEALTQVNLLEAVGPGSIIVEDLINRNETLVTVSTTNNALLATETPVPTDVVLNEGVSGATVVNTTPHLVPTQNDATVRAMNNNILPTEMFVLPKTITGATGGGTSGSGGAASVRPSGPSLLGLVDRVAKLEDSITKLMNVTNDMLAAYQYLYSHQRNMVETQDIKLVAATRLVSDGVRELSLLQVETALANSLETFTSQIKQGTLVFRESCVLSPVATRNDGSGNWPFLLTQEEICNLLRPTLGVNKWMSAVTAVNETSSDIEEMQYMVNVSWAQLKNTLFKFKHHSFLGHLWRIMLFFLMWLGELLKLVVQVAFEMWGFVDQCLNLLLGTCKLLASATSHSVFQQPDDTDDDMNGDSDGESGAGMSTILLFMAFAILHGLSLLLLYLVQCSCLLWQAIGSNARSAVFFIPQSVPDITSFLPYAAQVPAIQFLELVLQGLCEVTLDRLLLLLLALVITKLAFLPYHETPDSALLRNKRQRPYSSVSIDSSRRSASQMRIVYPPVKTEENLFSSRNTGISFSADVVPSVGEYSEADDNSFRIERKFPPSIGKAVIVVGSPIHTHGTPAPILEKKEQITDSEAVYTDDGEYLPSSIRHLRPVPQKEDMYVVQFPAPRSMSVPSPAARLGTSPMTSPSIPTHMARTQPTLPTTMAQNRGDKKNALRLQRHLRKSSKRRQTEKLRRAASDDTGRSILK